MIELKNADVGSVHEKGSLGNNGSHYTMTASGRDVWDKEDGAHFAYYEQEGDFDLSVRIESLTMSNLYTKAGIMARESLDADSRNIFMVAFGDNGPRRNNDGGCEFQYRAVKGEDSIALYPATTGGNEPLYPCEYPNNWMRLKRTGNEFAACFSNDGHKWLEYARHEMNLNTKLLVGICVTAHSEEQTCECRFSDLILL